jgi:FdhE protein
MMRTNRDDELLRGLQEEGQKRPELEEIIGFHQELVAARAEVEPELSLLEPAEREVEELIDQRIPLLRRWEPQWDEERFLRLAGQICDIGARHRQELAPQFGEIRSLLIDDPDRARKIVTDYLREGKVELLERPDIDQELLAFVLNNALHPFLQAYSAILIPLIKDERWYQRFCPVCGGEPDFGYLEEKVGGLRLLCSNCDTLWMYKRGECTFCGNYDKDTFAYYVGDDEVYRLYVCDKCRRYLKVLDGRQTAGQPLLPLERITTIGMDMAARQEGYH